MNNTAIDLREIQKQIKNIEDAKNMLFAMQQTRDAYIKDFLAWIAGSRTIIKNTALILSNGAKAVEKTRNPLFGISALETAYKSLSPISKAAANYGVSITNNLNRLLDTLQPLDVELLQLKQQNPQIGPTADLLISEINAINLLVARFRKEENERLRLAMRTISKWSDVPKLAPQNFNDFIMNFSDSIPVLHISTTLSNWKRMRTLSWDHAVETINNLERELQRFLEEYDTAIDMIRIGIQETDVFIKEILQICNSLVLQAKEIIRNFQNQTR